jgi:hypothetical protein
VLDDDRVAIRLIRHVMNYATRTGRQASGARPPLPLAC